MQALVVSPPAPGVTLREMPEPEMSAESLLVEVLECGICGTDRDIVAGKYGTPPPGSKELILGHENLGQVREVGSRVSGFSVGDLVVATVRRGCGSCRFCRSGHSDFCETGRFTERGINGRHGYLAARYAEVPEYLVKVPSALRSHAVLLEPLSVVEKAVQQGRAVRGRFDALPGFPPERPLRALVTGTGAIGMLAALVLASEGCSVVAVDRHGADTPAAALLARIGAAHVDTAAGLAALGADRFDLILEASGSPTLDFDLLGRLAPNGTIVLTGIPGADPTAFPVRGGALLRSLVLENQVLVGSVNANRTHFELGLAHLAAFRERWGDVAERLVTERRPIAEYAAPLLGKAGATIKSVLTLPAGAP